LEPPGEYDATVIPSVILGGGGRHMKQGGMKHAVALVVGVGFLTLTACSSSDPKPMTQPTPDQVRGHADRGFDNLKKEEKERGTQTNAPY